MAYERVSQTQWTQGELGPYLLARFDNKIYSAGAQTLENFLMLPQGGLMRRPGMKFVDGVGFNLASIAVVNQGTGYTSAPTVTIAAPPIGGGTTATATATVSGG